MISIIILSYNTKSLLKSCLNSLFVYIKETPFEVIVVDNASTDDSAAMLKSDFKKVKVIENNENVGFAAGCNIGAKAAQGEYLLFLNSDTEFTDESTLEKLTRHMTDEKVGVIGGMMLNADKSYQRSFGSFYTLPHVARMLFLGEESEMRRQSFDKVHETDWVSGGFMLVRKTAYDQVQGYDERYFMYVEDVDFCYRLKKQGFKILVDPRVTISHIGHGSSNRTFAVKNIYSGLARFYKQHRSSVEYHSLLMLLYIKAYLVLFFAKMKKDSVLTDRYKSAIASI